MKQIVTNKIYEHRKNRKVTQEALAEAVGVTRQTIIAIEKGNYTPSVLLAIRLAQQFKTNVEEVFALEEKL